MLAGAAHSDGAAKPRRGACSRLPRWPASDSARLNEVVEFIATLFLDTNVGGYRNTGFDLIYNVVGAVIAAFLIGRNPKDREPKGRGLSSGSQADR